MRTQVWERGHNVLGLKHIQDIFKSETEELSYLTFEALEDQTITFTSASEVNNVLSWSYDGNTWVEGNEVQVKSGDKIMCKGDCVTQEFYSATYPYYSIGQFNTSGYFNLSGNIYSLINLYKFPEFTEEDYINCMIMLLPGLLTTHTEQSGSKILQEQYSNLSGKELYYKVLEDYPRMVEDVNMEQIDIFTHLTLKNNYSKQQALNKIMSLGLPFTASSWEELVVSARNILMMDIPYQDISKKDFPNEFIEVYLYQMIKGELIGFSGLFENTKVINASELFLGTSACIADFSWLFDNCTSLMHAPKLTSKFLRGGCYHLMFYGCTNLVHAPELPATTLEEYCYYGMFKGCSNLNNITMLATDISAVNCLGNWTEGVSEKGTFIKSPNMNSLPTGVNGIPEGWTVINI